MTSFSETTLNVLLAERLTNKGLLGSAELVERHKKETKKPDVMMIVNGIKVILEGKMKKSNAKKILTKQCTERIENALCDISIGVIYDISTSGKLFHSINDLKKLLDKSNFEIAIWIPGYQTSIKKIDWYKENMKGLAKLIRSAVNEVATSEILKNTVDELKESIEIGSSLLVKSNSKRLQTLSEKLSKIIELPLPTNDSERLRTIKMALLILADAIIFYNVSSPLNPISTISELHSKHKTWLQAFINGFDEILKRDFESVYLVAKQIIEAFPDDSEKSLQKIVEECKSISSSKILLKHDLMGRIYHQLLFEDIAKNLSTFYTSIPAAWILARLSLDTYNDSWKNVSWSSIDDVTKFRVGDLACGSGTLLSAVYRTFEDKHIFESAAIEKEPDLNNLHKNLMEYVLTGCDVMPFAAHIATLTLALHNPDSTFTKTNILTLPIGKRPTDLGSINLLRMTKGVAKFSTFTGEETGSVRQSMEKKTVEEFEPEKESFDLLILNPPFARSCGDNLMFGSITTEKIRKGMKKTLNEILKRENLTGIGQAGLGAVFIAIADRYLKPGGRIAFVLPRNFLSGVSWQNIRAMLFPSEGHIYHLEYILLSSQPGSYNFSENTDLSECMIICRKLKEDEMGGRTIVANFHKKSENVFESLILSRQIKQFYMEAQKSPNEGIFTNVHAGYRQLMIGSKLSGKAYSINPEVIEENVDNWGRLVAFANPEITKISYQLFSSHNLVLIEKTLLSIPLKKVDDVGTIGPDRKQIHMSFEIVESGGIFDAFWGKKMEMNEISVNPNKRLKNKPKAKIQNLIDKSGKLLIAERLWLDTTSLVSICSTKRVLSNVWWPFNPDKLKKISNDDACKILSLWLNSTPGLLLYLSELEVTRGGWVGIKKQTLANLLILDVDSLSTTKIKKLVALFDKLKEKKFGMLKQQFLDASNEQGLRYNLDKELLNILQTKTIKKDDLIPLYQILHDESKHWHYEIDEKIDGDLEEDES